ncbi:DUF469 family protein [Chitinimonas arctica]|uniref:DUF469 family protein n=1 Tax=Chitinimonas arctica TaxID=2594795 RepID=A0A516SKB4_9NEIS|nr:50S ribosome-binding protein YggL [Chitinimonas arctica]QDQ28458.1 DUF469 family protein [Chitinimonas arctica]
MPSWINRNSTTRIRRLNSRQRKKYHLAEFQELGFGLTVRFRHMLAETEQDQWINDLCVAAEGLNLLVGGFGVGPDKDTTEGFVAAERGSTSTEQRDGLLAFVQAYPLVAEAKAGELVDGWYADTDGE